MTAILLRVLLLLSIGIATVDAAEQAASTREFGRVVVLNSTDPYLPTFVALDSALQEAVREASDVPVEFFSEPMDVYRFSRQQLEAGLTPQLKIKYRDVPIDVIAAYGTAALDYAERHSQDIWPGAAIVFNAVSSAMVGERTLGPRTAGVTVDVDFGNTIGLALKLRPGTSRVAVVAGTAELDYRLSSRLRAELRQYASRLDVDYLVGLPLNDTIAAVRQLPPDAIVLYATMFRDGAGIPLMPREVLRKIAAVSPVPVFGVYEAYLGAGLTAGVIASDASQGRRAGEIIARILDGEAPSAIGLIESTAPNCMADWRQLAKWGISETLLPGDCEILFRDVTVWEKYRWQILLILLLILAQSLMIALLALHRRRLRLAQAELKTAYALRTESEQNASVLRRRLMRFSRERSMGAMVTTISHEISQPLTAIQNYAQAAMRRFQTDPGDKSKLIELLGKIEGQAERAGAITQRVRSLITSRDAQLAPMALSVLVEEVVPMVQSDCDALDCRIEYRPANALCPVLADKLQIQLVLVNLLSNAINATARRGISGGLITIDATLLGDQKVQISVTDEGTGMSSRQAAHIFDLLYSDSGEGMGLGLAICRDIIELHGGEIGYEENPAGGSIFRFTLSTGEA